jgi:hypothetical protein
MKWANTAWASARLEPHASAEARAVSSFMVPVLKTSVW